MALDNSFSIIYMVGKFNDDAKSLILEPAFAGLDHIFTSPMEICDSCGNQDVQDVIVSGTTPITSILLDYVGIGALDSMKSQHVVPFLVKNLKWRIVVVCSLKSIWK
jgi:tyrosinase